MCVRTQRKHSAYGTRHTWDCHTLPILSSVEATHDGIKLF